MHSTGNLIFTSYSWEGDYILKSFYYQLLLLKVTMYTHYKGIYVNRETVSENRSHKLMGALHILGPKLEAMK